MSDAIRFAGLPDLADDPPPAGQTVLILAAQEGEAASLQALLRLHDVHAVVCADLDALAAGIDERAGAALITAAALPGAGAARLADRLEAQPDWSDLPFIILSGGAARHVQRSRDRLPGRMRSVLRLQQPYDPGSLISAVEMALAGRQLQLRLRDQTGLLGQAAADRAQAEDRLEAATRALRSSSERLDLVLNSGAILGSLTWDVEADHLTGDERCARLFSLEPERLRQGISIAEARAAVHPDDLSPTIHILGGVLQSGGGYRSEYRVRSGAAGWRWVESSGYVSGRSGERRQLSAVILDISGRKRVEEALRSSELELRLITDALPFLVAFVDRSLIYRFANKAHQDWLYRDPQELVGRPVRDVITQTIRAAVGEQGLVARHDAMRRALRGETVTLQAAWPHRDGRRREAEIRYVPRLDAAGAVLGFHVFVLDVTERAMAAETLRDAAEVLERRVIERTAALRAESAERQRAEEALRQSQKMEAVGQLTGGIAHDFNNMLTGIIGSLDLMERRIEQGRSHELGRFMAAARSSAERAAALTHRLLAFSRRQPLDARPIDVNRLIGSLVELLTRTIGENVTLEVALADALPLAQADANQLENALLNLVINARDAMADGGRLRIATGCFEQTPPAHGEAGSDGLRTGRYVEVAVTDSGSGMDPDVLSRAFEPFYTTKPVGQGTGLGLSMIYGFAQQSGGSVTILSAPGQGTTVRLFLPLANAPAPDAVAGGWRAGVTGAGVASWAGSRRSSGETVLLVEDDAAVRLLVLELLVELGCVGIEAVDAAAALAVLDTSKRIDLLVTDVGLPGMDGRQLADLARRSRPELPVLFMTGYAHSAATRSGFLAPGMQLITKPFALEAMAQRISGMI